MKLEPSETQAQIEGAAREYAARAVAPFAAERDAREEFPEEALRGLAALGLTTINVPEAYGGGAAGPVAFALAVEQMARACASTAVMMSVTNMVAETIARFGTEPQRRAYLPRLVSGEIVTASFALSESGAGSDPGAMRSTATRRGSTWVIDGSKQWITAADRAGLLLVWARTAPLETGARGLSCFLVEGGAPGLHFGRSEDKMGLRASPTVPIVLDGCAVDDGALLGDLNGGFRVAMSALDGGRIGIGAQAVGIAGAAFDESVEYAKRRVAFGLPIGRHQAVAFKLADMRASLDAARLLVLRAAWLKESGARFTREASMAKLWASEAAVRVCNDAVQIHGGYGCIREYAAERHLRDARVTTLYEGTSEIQRVVIARAILS